MNSLLHPRNFGVADKFALLGIAGVAALSLIGNVAGGNSAQAGQKKAEIAALPTCGQIVGGIPDPDREGFSLFNLMIPFKGDMSGLSAEDRADAGPGWLWPDAVQVFIDGVPESPPRPGSWGSIKVLGDSVDRNYAEERSLVATTETNLGTKACALTFVIEPN